MSTHKKSAQRQEDLFDLMYSLKNKLGITKLIKVIYDLDKKHLDRDEEKIVESVIVEVCTVLDVDTVYILDKLAHSRDEQKHMGVNFVCTILKDEFDFTLKKIKAIFGIHESNVSKRINSIRNLDPKNKIDVKQTVLYDRVLKNLKEKNVII